MVTLLPSTDPFGEAEHKSFLKRVFSILKACRETILSLLRTIGKATISCFNKLCLLVKKLWGKLWGSNDSDDDETLEEIPMETEEISQEEKEIVDQMILETKEEQEKVERVLFDVSEVVENYAKRFEERKLKAENARKEIRQRNAEKALNDVRETSEELLQELQRKKVETEEKIKKLEEEAKKEQEEKDRIANLETDKLLSETRQQFEQFMSSRKRLPDPCQEASEELNRSLSNWIDCLDPEE
ncbi:unnamed protein product [Caenorhabditis nigoni]